MNIYIHEMRSYRKSILVWSLSLAALSGLYIVLYTAVYTDIESFKVVLMSLPEVVRKILSIYVESIATLEGFYSFAFVYLILCGAIQAMNIGVSIISKEISEKTADFLMTKPVSRMNILTYKLLAAFSSIVLTNVIFFAITIPLTFTVGHEFNMRTFVMISATLFFLQLIFMALGVIIAIVSGNIKSVTSVSLSTVFGFFIISSLGSVIGEKAVRYISPFQYFDLAYIVKNSAYESKYMITGAAIVIVSIIASYMIYIKKDIHTV
ncbi:MAG: ABC transporter permease subunit [Saccharofermentanales bacterium]